MSKRLTDTDKWDDPWFVRLSPLNKLLWNYICDRCDPSGVIDLCPELATVQIGGHITEDSMLDFGSRVRKLPSGKWQIVKFLSFQYKTVDFNCPTHIKVIKGILDNGLEHPIANLPPNLRHTLVPRVHRTLKEEEEDKEEDEDEETDTEGETYIDKETGERYKW
jgi:hypothetical protein